jgi:hypothetical protein
MEKGSASRVGSNWSTSTARRLKMAGQEMTDYVSGAEILDAEPTIQRVDALHLGHFPRPWLSVSSHFIDELTREDGTP